MAFKVSISGDDSFENKGEKAAFERNFSEEVRAFVHRLAVKPNVSVVKWNLSVDSTEDEGSGK